MLAAANRRTNQALAELSVRPRQGDAVDGEVDLRCKTPPGRRSGQRRAVDSDTSRPGRGARRRRRAQTNSPTSSPCTDTTSASRWAPDARKRCRPDRCNTLWVSRFRIAERAIGCQRAQCRPARHGRVGASAAHRPADRIARMAVDRLVLLEPPQRIPVETHGARHRAVAVDIEYPRRRSVGLTGAYQGVQPRRTQLHSLRVVLVAQELHADIRQRDVVLRVVGNLPDIARRTGVEDEHMSR